MKWFENLELLGLMILLIIGFSIFTPSDNKTSSPAASISDNTKSEFDKYYIIEKKDNDQTNIRLYIYVSDVSKIKDINQLLVEKYNNDKTKYMSSYYFNKKGIGKTYMDKQVNENISDKEKDRIFKYLIAVYNFNPSNSYEKLEFEQH